MKRYLVFVLGIFFLTILSYGSFKKLSSSSFQSFLIFDFNNGTNTFNLEESKNKLDDNFPNITATALPIKYLKARYYLEMDSIKQAKELLYKSIKDNPYIFAPEVLLAQIYLSENKLDSALKYSKKAFFGLSDNNRHRDTYFKVLKELKDSVSLDSAFLMIKNKDNSSHWTDYLLTRNDINKKPDKRLLTLLEELPSRFPKEDTLKINNIRRFIQLGGDRYTEALVNSEKGNIEFRNENYLEAVKFYESAILLDNQQYLFYENAAISYDNLKNYLKAEEYFNKVIYDFKTTDGKSEFHKGLMLIKNNNQKGCEYLRKSANKNYVGASSGIRAVNVFFQLCNN